MVAGLKGKEIPEYQKALYALEAKKLNEVKK